jgi:hypothetical protein
MTKTGCSTRGRPRRPTLRSMCRASVRQTNADQNWAKRPKRNALLFRASGLRELAPLWTLNSFNFLRVSWSALYYMTTLKLYINRIFSPIHQNSFKRQYGKTVHIFSPVDLNPDKNLNHKPKSRALTCPPEFWAPDHADRSSDGHQSTSGNAQCSFSTPRLSMRAYQLNKISTSQWSAEKVEQH